MVHFDTDYMAGAHPAVLSRLVATNSERTTGYCSDAHCARAKKLILDAFGIPEGEVFFLEGGTQTNATVIDRLIGRGEGVIAADTAHINVHEAGAVENDGHKVLTVPGRDGKICAGQIEELMNDFNADGSAGHMVRPAMVYISYPTELGTLYSKDELKEIYGVCRANDLPLYIDGARLAYGLAAAEGELSAADLASLCDVFYIGGTKCGTLFGEAVVTKRPQLLPRFISHVKRHGALIAKGRLLGVQFEALFDDGLYFEIGRYGVRLARRLKEGLLARGMRMLVDSPTNQQFFVLPNSVIDRLREHVTFELWGIRGDKETAVRFVTDWSSTEADVDHLLTHLSAIL